MSPNQPGDRQPPNHGTWRAVAALPAMIASLLLLVFLLGGAGRWEAPVLLSWLIAGVLILSAPGERLAVRVACRFRRLTALDRAHIAPMLTAVLEACERHDIDLYVCDRRDVNAYAAGHRSIAVTRQVIDRHREDDLSDDVLAGLLSHEIGHIVTRSVRWSLIIAWFALPWRLAYRVGGRIAARFATRQPRVLLAGVVLTAFSVAISQAVQRGEGGTAAVLSALALCPVISAVADAAISRASEHEADRYAAQIGYATALSLALKTTQIAEAGQPSRLLRYHPAIDRRLRRLEVASGDPAGSILETRV